MISSDLQSQIFEKKKIDGSNLGQMGQDFLKFLKFGSLVFFEIA